MIARSPSLTEQVKTHLKERIMRGEFDEGRIPPETELATELGVSRTTVRDALSRLEQEGAIFRKQGSGTFVNAPGLQIKSRLEDIWSYEEVLRDHGYTPSVRVVGIDTVPVDPATADELNMEPGASLLVMEKVFLENDDPVILTINRIPAAIIRDEIAGDDTEPIFALLEAHCDRHLAYYVSEIVPVALTERLAGLLGLASGTPAVCFEEVGFDQDNEPIVKATSYFRDDLLRLRLIRRKSGA